jgi:beta-N-acetylhexosaminidase
MKTISHPRATIFGCSGPLLTSEEKDFFKRYQPLGFILFSRNCQSPEQVKSLVRDLKACVDHTDVPILIDQEGGRVVRLKPPYWRPTPHAALFGDIARDDLELAKWCVQANAMLIGHELMHLGINVNCAPLLDLPIVGSHPIISNRAFSSSIDITVDLAESYLLGLSQMGITGIIKHLPGHGRALVDSHESLPIIQTDSDTLMETDFLAFKNLCTHLQDYPHLSPWGMTAHVVYSKLDPHLPATHSPIIIEKFIRSFIGFSGCLITDCLTMKALSGSWRQRVENSLKAGCDIVLHCSGQFEEMLEVAIATPPISTDTYEIIKHSLLTSPLLAIDVDKLESNLQGYLKPYLKSVSYA